jgi:hypothetical protein
LKFQKVGLGCLPALALKLSHFEADIWSRFGQERLTRLSDMKDILTFLQYLCNGQMSLAQELMAQPVLKGMTNKR